MTTAPDESTLSQSCDQCGVRVRQGFVPPQRTQRRQTRFAVDRLFCSISCMDAWTKSCSRNQAAS